ncbi:MAG: TPM domain-containing protein [Bdellovibrionales bacterium]|nr:TPM domain-containing protein [Bdellovibrionales bacterium]
MHKKWVTKYLSEEQVADISKAVQQAELGTGGDIVPMIVRRSSAVRHVPLVLGLSFALIFLGIEMLGLNGWYFSDFLPFLMGHWAYQVGFLLVLLLIAWGLSHLHPVQRLLTSDEDEKEQVWKRAQLEFFLHRLNRTHKKTAVLIFVSVMERRAVILADEGIAKHLPPQTWEEVLKPLTGFMRSGEWAKGFQDAIRRSGELLKQHLPEHDAANEISNNLIIKE